jgi:aspartate racemase
VPDALAPAADADADDDIVGILSGMGPYAGLDLAQKIHRHTAAQVDQEHLSVALLSYPGWIPDRSTYLFDHAKPNPTPALAKIARRLEAAGATAVGMPCNTAHCPPIFDALTERLADAGSPVRLVHMIEETARYLKEQHPGVERVGVLSSLAVYRLSLYRDVLSEAGFTVVRPDEEAQVARVNPVIFDEDYGIKAQSDPVTDRARRALLRAADGLADHGAEAIILGCTEFPLAIPQRGAHGLPMIDPTRVLARALIRTATPEKLAAASPDEPHLAPAG